MIYPDCHDDAVNGSKDGGRPVDMGRPVRKSSRADSFFRCSLCLV